MGMEGHSAEEQNALFSKNSKIPLKNVGFTKKQKKFFKINKNY